MPLSWFAAIGNKTGAAIGTSNGTCGNITIKNTVASVKAKKGDEAVNYIGAGCENTDCGTITIEEGVIIEKSIHRN